MADFLPHHPSPSGANARADDDCKHHIGIHGVSELFPLFNGNPGSAYSLYTIVYYLYDMFYKQWEYGPVAASAVVLFAIVLLTIVQMIIQRKWKHY